MAHPSLIRMKRTKEYRGTTMVAFKRRDNSGYFVKVGSFKQFLGSGKTLDEAYTSAEESYDFIMKGKR